MRLQKYLASAGIASRRKCDEYIAMGRVEVNGQTVREPGTVIDPARDKVKYMGKPVRAEQPVYIMLHKPAGCVSTCKDEKGRQTVMDYVRDIQSRLYPVGRLDFMSEGLLILTNDGALMQALTHPKHHVQKKYLAVIDSGITSEEAKRLEEGIALEDGKTAPAIFNILSTSAGRSEILCVIREGKNRQLRRMFEAIEKNVVYLKRVGQGELALGNLKKGKYRRLTEQEVSYLKSLR